MTFTHKRSRINQMIRTSSTTGGHGSDYYFGSTPSSYTNAIAIADKQQQQQNGNEVGYNLRSRKPPKCNTKIKTNTNTNTNTHTNGFQEVGSLHQHVNSLKEMVFSPILYPELFANFDLTPPIGVLFCGPPGTGKTLVARALAAAASEVGGKEVKFYVQNGADLLSKWVGESERQLRLLFEEAKKNQPSIIFFDEIDGLCPARSTNQEQIHNTIVSTLLALMDDIHSRGQVFLIGATNRVDSIDRALRRPGRFDPEFNFTLPGYDARAEILDIHTRKWKHPPSYELKSELAAKCVGYSGADIKALCTEAVMAAFREKYPRLYIGKEKCVIDVDSIRVEKHHFVQAMSAITPTAHRGGAVVGGKSAATPQGTTME